MASEYLKWKYRDVKPEEQKELTPREKRRNWWYYHWWMLLLGVIAAALAADLICVALGVGRTRPDYQIAYVGSAPISEDAAAAVEHALAALGEDCDGDGAVTVLLNSYIRYTPDASGGADAVLYAEGAEARLVGDLESCDSFFFLLDDPDRFQDRYQVLLLPDGNEPGTADRGTDCAILWSDCPALEQEETVSGLWIARRGFWSGKTVRNSEACEALWKAVREGAGA